MLISLAADLLVVIHLAFVLFVVFGGLLAPHWPRLAWLHLPALAWGAFIELSGGICPLTPWENSLRLAAGAAGYQGGFIEQYLIPLIYPPGLTRETQILLGLGVLLVNAAAYIGFLSRRR